LQDAAVRAHDAVRAEAASREYEPTLATTLTLGFALWPWLYVVQVGDSRCYLFSRGELSRHTRDQTMAQELADAGAIRPEEIERSPFAHTLTSAIGGEDARPEATRVDISDRGCIVIFCTDGLTKHVSDDEIAEHCGRIQSAEQMSRDLLQLALDRGGSDNITIIVGRAPLKQPA
jgi:serine/threonine protein phosphatase PrpC